MDQARIEKLETRLAYQEQTIRELGDEIYRQQREIDTLRRSLDALRERMQSLSEAPPGAGAADEKPPHY